MWTRHSPQTRIVRHDLSQQHISRRLVTIYVDPGDSDQPGSVGIPLPGRNLRVAHTPNRRTRDPCERGHCWVRNWNATRQVSRYDTPMLCRVRHSNGTRDARIGRAVYRRRTNRCADPRSPHHHRRGGKSCRLERRVGSHARGDRRHIGCGNQRRRRNIRHLLSPGQEGMGLRRAQRVGQRRIRVLRERASGAERTLVCRSGCFRPRRRPQPTPTPKV